MTGNGRSRLRRAGIGLRLLAAFAALGLTANLAATVARMPTELCSFPTFQAGGCWGSTAIAVAGLAGLLELFAAALFRRDDAPSTRTLAAADGFAVLTGIAFALAGYSSFRLLGFVLFGTALGGATVPLIARSAREPAEARRDGDRSAGGPTLRETAIGLHVSAGLAGVGGVVGLWEPVLTSPARVCGLLWASVGPTLITYPCYSLSSLLHPGLVTLAAFASALLLAEGPEVAKPAGLLVGTLAIASGFRLVYQGDVITPVAGVILFGAGTLLLALALHPSSTPKAGP